MCVSDIKLLYLDFRSPKITLVICRNLQCGGLKLQQKFNMTALSAFIIKVYTGSPWKYQTELVFLNKFTSAFKKRDIIQLWEWKIYISSDMTSVGLKWRSLGFTSYTEAQKWCCGAPVGRFRLCCYLCWFEMSPNSVLVSIWRHYVVSL